MTRFSFHVGIFFAALCVFTLTVTLAAYPASAATYSGTVRNGTTSKPAVGVDVLLLSLEGNMQTVASTKSDAQGHFHFIYTAAGQMPLLIRAVYKGMNFHAMLPPGSTSADVNIYEPSSDTHTVQVPQRLVVFQPNGSTLLVGEEYVVQNQSQPPVTYFKTDGDFEFKTPEGADHTQVSTQGPGSEGMPLVQATMDRGKNQFAIAYAFRPGESAVKLSYDIPYSSSRALLQLPTVYAAKNVVLLAPPTVTLSAPGFQPAGTEQGMSVYTRDGVPAGTVIDVSLSGTAPPPGNGDQAGQPDSAGPSDAAATNRDGGTPVIAVAPRLDTLKWVLLGGFAALFMLGAGFLLRKPLPGAGPPASAFPSPSGRSAGAASAPATTTPAASVIGTVDREVGASLDELKDRLFRLELRHQAGTISDTDYAEQRARAEKILRDLVRG
jgi:hypothetical protein